jgi:hypothetical protein
MSDPLQNYPRAKGRQSEQKNEAPPDDEEDEAGTGSLTLRDCDGNAVVHLEWVNGLIITNGAHEFEGGCFESPYCL